MIKVYGGTVKGGGNLCEKCRSYHFIRMTNNKEQRFCKENDEVMDCSVTECNRFDDRSKPSVYDMQQIAWVVEPTNKKGVIGFLSPAEYRKKHGEYATPEIPGVN